MLRRLAAVFAVSLATFLPPVHAQSNCAPDGVQASGSIYRICMPSGGNYNGTLVVWAHGFQDAGTPVGIPEDQLCASGICIPDVMNFLGNAFATNSYSKTGMAIVQGKQDLLDLVNIFAAKHGRPAKVYLLGASEGGIITALSLEQHPDVYVAGLAMCGPVGDFPLQINYFGDGRATFNYFFPGVIPGPAFDPEPWLVANWAEYYSLFVRPALLDPANRSRLEQWAAVSQLPADPANWLATVEQSARDVLRYSVVNLRDATETLGGFPYDNRHRWFYGSADDVALNAAVPRVDVSPAALANMQANYNTTGVLARPVVTMHTLLDQQIPFWHEWLYTIKTWTSGAYGTRHYNIPIDRYGHCNFSLEEVLYGFFAMLYFDSAVNQAGVAAATIDTTRSANLHDRVRAALKPFRGRGDPSIPTDSWGGGKGKGRDHPRGKP